MKGYSESWRYNSVSYLVILIWFRVGYVVTLCKTTPSDGELLVTTAKENILIFATIQESRSAFIVLSVVFDTKVVKK